MLGYGCFYLTRNSLPYVAPVMEADPTLGFNLTKVGILASAFPIAYAFSKVIHMHIARRHDTPIRTCIHRHISGTGRVPCSLVHTSTCRWGRSCPTTPAPLLTRSLSPACWGTA